MASHPGAWSHGRSNPVPRRGVAQDHPAHPGSAGDVEVPQGLDERPLVVDAAMQRRLGEPPGTREGALPPPLQDCPRLTDPVAVLGAHPGPLGYATVQLRVDQLDAAHAALVEHGAADLRPGEVDCVHAGVIEEHPGEGGAPQAHPLKACSGEALLAEHGHGHHARAHSGRSTSGSSRDQLI